MKTIIENYASTIIASIVVLALMGILLAVPFKDEEGNTRYGIYGFMAMHADLDRGLYDEMDGTAEVVNSNQQILNPKIKFDSSKGTIKVGNRIVLEDWFLVTLASNTSNEETFRLSDIDTSKVYYELVSIQYYDLEDKTLKNYEFAGSNFATGNSNKKTVRFSNAGAYYITIFCQDLVNGKNSTEIIMFPVTK